MEFKNNLLGACMQLELANNICHQPDNLSFILHAEQQSNLFITSAR